MYIKPDLWRQIPEQVKRKLQKIELNIDILSNKCRASVADTNNTFYYSILKYKQASDLFVFLWFLFWIILLGDNLEQTY